MNFHLLLKNLLTIICFFMYNIKKHKGVIILKTDRLFKFAKEMAEMSDFKRQQIGCVVTYKKKMIATGFNCHKTHPLQKEYNKLRYEGYNTPHCLHAEMHALLPIRNMDIDWGKVKVFTYRICKGDKERAALARPCPGCIAYMKSLGIKNIYYTTSNTPVHEVLDI